MVIEQSKETSKPSESEFNQTNSTLRSMLRILAEAVAARLAHEQSDNSHQHPAPDGK